VPVPDQVQFIPGLNLVFAPGELPSAEEVLKAVDPSGSTIRDLLEKFSDRVPKERLMEFGKLFESVTVKGPSYKKDLKRCPGPGTGSTSQAFNVTVPLATPALLDPARRPSCLPVADTTFILDPQKVDIGYKVDFLAPFDAPLPRKYVTPNNQLAPNLRIDWSWRADGPSINFGEQAKPPTAGLDSHQDSPTGDTVAPPSEAAAGPPRAYSENLPTPDAIAAAIPPEGIPFEALEALFGIGAEQKGAFWSMFKQVAKYIDWNALCFRLPPFPSDREIWNAIPADGEEGILMEDLLEKFKDRVPHCLKKRFEDAVERHALQVYEDEPEWNQADWPDWAQDSSSE
jgi:hypothetical protein